MEIQPVLINILFQFLKIKFIGVTLFNKFLEYSSIIHKLYKALYAYAPQFSLPPSPYVWLPLPSSPSPHPLSLLVTTILLSVSMRCFVYLFVHLLLSVLYLMSEITWFLSFSHHISFTLHDTLKIHPCCCKGTLFSMVKKMFFFTFYCKTVMYRVSYIITCNGNFSGSGEVV